MHYGAFLAGPRGVQQWPGGSGSTIIDSARQQIVKDTCDSVWVTINNTGSAVGAAATLSTPFDHYDGLTTQDLRMLDAAACCGPTGGIGVVLNAAPWCMMTNFTGVRKALGTMPTVLNGLATGTDYTTVNSYTVNDANLADWANFCEWFLHRYTGGKYNLPIKWVAHWSERKGYWNPTLGAWDEARHVAAYNAVHTKLKGSSYPAVAALEIGGPYSTMRNGLDSGVNTAAGGHVTPALASDGSSVRSTITVGGVGWHIDARTLNANIYFAAHANPPDFVVFDLWYAQSNANTGVSTDPDMRPTVDWAVGTPNTVVASDRQVVFDDRERGEIVGNYFQGLFPGKPIKCIETYPGSKGLATDFTIMRDSLAAGGVDDMVLWIAAGAPVVGSKLWDAANVRTPVGDAMLATVVPRAPVTANDGHGGSLTTDGYVPGVGVGPASGPGPLTVSIFGSAYLLETASYSHAVDRMQMTLTLVHDSDSVHALDYDSGVQTFNPAFAFPRTTGSPIFASGQQSVTLMLSGTYTLTAHFKMWTDPVVASPLLDLTVTQVLTVTQSQLAMSASIGLGGFFFPDDQ